MPETPLSILLAEDDDAHVEAIRRAFRAVGARVEIRAVTSLSAYRAAVKAAPPDIALMDLNLSDGKATDALVSPAEASGFPVLIMTSFGDEQVAVEAMKAGALDYVVKSPEVFRALPSTVERALREWRLLQDNRRSSEKLRLSAERWQHTFDAIADTLLVLEPDHTIREINQAGCITFGMSREDMIGRKCFEVVHGTDQPIGECPCTRAASTGASATVRYEERGRTFELVAWPMRGAGGELEGFVHVVKDITAEVAADEEKARLEEQLRVSQKLEAVGSLAGGIAHDFNNLLSVVLGYSRFALDEVGEHDTIRADLTEIHNAGEKAAKLTQRLLAFSRRQVVEPTVLSVNAVVVDLDRMLRRLLGEHIDVLLHLADDLGSVLADLGQVEQVLMNLAINARDAMPNGGTLTIETSNQELDAGYSKSHAAVQPGPHVMLAVSDTGCGMDAATRGRVFEPFFTTKEMGSGTGLGLAVVYGIVKQAGGDIWVYSEVGQGTTFKLYLPRTDERPSAGATRATRVAAGQETVLVVEDEQAVRRLAVRILTNAGYHVVSAGSGPEALTLMQDYADEVHLLLTDVVMPRMSGRVLAERLRAIRPRLRVLYMSGYTDNVVSQHGVLEAGVRILAKPFSAVELSRKVREVLEGSDG